MKGFPTLSEKEVVVIVADGATGHILNLKFDLYRNDTDDNIYRLFDNIDLAKEFIKQQSIYNDELEFLIYDENQTILEYIEATNWKS